VKRREPGMGLNADLVGKEYTRSTFEVTARAIEEYARATNDLNERYLGEEVLASPVFPVVPAFNSFMEAAMDPELGADLLRLVHGMEDHMLYAPIVPGDRLTVSPVLESVDQKDTGETFTVAARLARGEGEPVAEVRGTMFIRGTGNRRAAAAAAASGAPSGKPAYEEATKIDEDQTFRYAEASGDHNPIHVDSDTAKMAGLPGIIVHGMCTMAIATKGAVNGLAGGDPSRVKRVSARFSRPVLPGQELTTRFWDEQNGVYAFETYNPDGKAVIKGGRAEIL
jgi:acyl dehydratase